MKIHWHRNDCFDHQIIHFFNRYIFLLAEKVVCLNIKIRHTLYLGDFVAVCTRATVHVCTGYYYMSIIS